MNDADRREGGGDDAEEMRRAFEAFMLGGKKRTPEKGKDEAASPATPSSSRGKKKKKKKKKSSLGGGSVAAASKQTPPPKRTPPFGEIDEEDRPTAPQQTTLSKSDKKRYYQLLRSFNNKVRDSWLEIDDRILSILENIVAIRGRLPLEWRVLHLPELGGEASHGDEGAVENGDDWKYHGFHGKPRDSSYAFHLRAEDVRLALSHDLEQHEEMLRGVRRLLTELADRHEGLGRAVDALWRHHLECGGGPRTDDAGHLVRRVTDAFGMLSSELYRKQRLAPRILESTRDEILGVEERMSGAPGPASGGGRDTEGLKTARECCRLWRRSSGESCIDEGLISYLSKLGGTPRQNINE